MSVADEHSRSATAVFWAPARLRAAVMALLAGLFALRVIGQVLVTYADIDWLPAVEHWQSGLLPYPALLASQVLILGTMAAIIADVWRGRGRLARPGPWAAAGLRWFGAVYLASMIVRYIVTMAVRPEWRWFGHSIPIVFHVVLATFLLVYAGAPGTATRSMPGGKSR